MEPKPKADVLFRVEMPCELEAVRPAVASARTHLAANGLSEETVAACELALVEACNNAILYATQAARSKPVEIQACSGKAGIELQVIDHTAGFDLPEASKLPAPESEHGRGLFIIQSLMDEVVYLRGRAENRLLLRKRLEAGAPGTRPAVEEVTAANKETNGGGLSDLSKNLPAPGKKKIEEIQQKLALSEHVISTMARELCFRSEAMAAIFRCASDLGTAADLHKFLGQLLGDLLHIVAADWFVLRLVSRKNSRLEVSICSKDCPELGPLDLPEECLAENSTRGRIAGGTEAGLIGREDNGQPRSFSNRRLNHRLASKASSAELCAATMRADIHFDGTQPLHEDDPLMKLLPQSTGVVRPIQMGSTLLGTLTVGRSAGEAQFAPNQVEVIHTFADFLAIQLVNSRLQQEQVDRQVSAHELEIARNIQQSLLPTSFPALQGFGLAGYCISAREVGGDFYDVIPLSGQRTLLVVADVMGKGVPAALFAATLRTLVRTMTEWTQRPSELLARINRLLYGELSSVDMFITAQMALVDGRMGRLTVGNAGHCPLLVTTLAGEISWIAPKGLPLGILQDATFADDLISLEDCASVMLYTDGLTEARNPAGEFYGPDRLGDWLKSQCAARPSATELATAFQQEMRAFQANGPINDDQTMLILAHDQLSQVVPAPATTVSNTLSSAPSFIRTVTAG
jgi:serine phosphatase RsbU (regulator of sigma subunit)/anti-sigma regulatory factor (Ser/Thr protein kinase)